MERVIILGAGGLARELVWVFQEINKVTPKWDVIGFIDEDPQKQGQIFCEIPVFGGFDWFSKSVDLQDLKVICGVGDTSVRKRMVEKAKGLQLDFCSVIEPSVKMSDYIQYGEGVVICAGNIITTQVTIGNHVFINLANTIGHDVFIRDFVNLDPGNNVSGNVTFGEGVRAGTGCTFTPGVTIGEWSTIGAASIVTKDIPPYSFAVGRPARVIRRINEN